MEFGLLDGYAMRIVKTTSGRRLCIRTSVTHVSVVHGGACGTVVEGEIPAFAGMTWGAGVRETGRRTVCGACAPTGFLPTQE